MSDQEIIDPIKAELENPKQVQQFLVDGELIIPIQFTIPPILFGKKDTYLTTWSPYINNIKTKRVFQIYPHYLKTTQKWGSIQYLNREMADKIIQNLSRDLHIIYNCHSYDSITHSYEIVRKATTYPTQLYENEMYCITTEVLDQRTKTFYNLIIEQPKEMLSTITEKEEILNSINELRMAYLLKPLSLSRLQQKKLQKTFSFFDRTKSP